ncbi:dihydrodipicolinate reductase [Bailinhaonella thermotolerans]|uniref:Dihydrodipicolinate reductase n=1 Tax=Bailinhaonella thermotolerans TaxID=1070861 RepID=A0A3A4AUM5_9ACTN|nr:dihydrodipicolinate reductase [Bailinhaonella thermotolerans]RJL25148.1 dihydrodipicolinate reductase [Bailinhaonella thermotolerans]
MPVSPSHRVIQWATGAVGGYSLRSVISRPWLELAGVLVFDPKKAGRDAGELVGAGPTGVVTTADVHEIMAIPADCVLHMPLPAPFAGGSRTDDVETICALLRSGKNVITTTGFVYPQAYGRGLVERLEEACREGGTSLHGTGINPGFMCDLLPLALSGLCVRLDHIYARECSDFSGHPSARIVGDLIGFGRAPEEYVRSVRPFRAFQRGLFAESVHLVAAALGVELDEVEERDEYDLAREDFEVAAGVVRRGTVCASRWLFSGLVRGRPFMTIECVYKSDAARVGRWPSPGFSAHIEGVPQLMLSVDEVTQGLAGAAAHAVNAVPAVCAAPPGVRTLLDLPLTTGRGTARLA